MSSAGIRSLALAYPEGRRTNDYWLERYPELVSSREQSFLGKLWEKSPTGTDVGATFDREMAPYLGDPFRGTVERRVLGPGETALGLELRAAQRALAAANVSAREVDLLMVTSFLPDMVGVGNAAFLAAELGLKGAAWNLESACSSAMVALQSGCALIRAGEYRRVLVVVSCTYSRVTDEKDTLSWTVGDGAAAFLLESCEPGFGVLGAKVVHTANSCGALHYALEVEREREAVVRMRATPKAARSLREISETCLHVCTEGALRAADVRLEEIDFFVFNSPVAWYAPFCARALGVDPERTLDTYREFGNVGPVLMPTNLHRAATSGRIRRGDRVLLYTVGSVSSAGAAVVRWGDVQLAEQV